jgi:hypothetical protein
MSPSSRVPASASIRSCARYTSANSRPLLELLGADQLGFEPVDTPDKAAQQRARPAAEVVVAQRQLVDPLSEHREPVAGAHGRVCEIEAILSQITPISGALQQQRRKLLRRGDQQLAVALRQQLL